MENINLTEDIFKKHYMICALWTEEEQMGNLTIFDFSDEALEKVQKDVKAFLEKAGDLINEDNAEQAGHDFWLTRNGHGAGFWDRGDEFYGGKKNAEKLSAIARKMGEITIEAGDDNKVYFL